MVYPWLIVTYVPARISGRSDARAADSDETKNEKCGIKCNIKAITIKMREFHDQFVKSMVYK